MADQIYQQPVYQQVPNNQQPTTQYVQTAYPAAQDSSLFSLNVQDTQFWKGALIGAAVALLVTNETVQKGVVKTASKLTAAAQSGIEEVKEKFEDAKAEAKAEMAGDASAE